MKKDQRDFLERFIRFMKEEGFVYGPSPEIYGGLAGFYTYGPMGKRLKQAIEMFLRNHLYDYDFNEVEVPTIMPEVVWKASGHVDNFTDPVVQCSSCHAYFRLDTLISEQLGIEDVDPKDLKEYISKLKCPVCGGKFENKVEYKSLMMKTTVGLNTVAYARPETATTTYLPFVNYVHYFRNKLPFGVFQIGKAYRNEISPRKHLLRGREFTQAEAQLFLFKEQKQDFEDRLDFDFEMNLLNDKDQMLRLKPKDAFKKGVFMNSAYAFAVAITYKSFLEMGFTNLRLRQHKPDEKAFYAIDAWDVEINLNSFGWTEVCGVHDRGDYDLTQHSKFSKKSLSLFNEKTKEQEVPHIIEIAYGVDRIFFSLLDASFNHFDVSEGKTTLKLPLALSPIQVAVFPLLKKDPLLEKSREILSLLRKHFTTFYDVSGAIGRRYLRANKKGIPFAVTIDFDTLEDESVTIRDRDSEKQIRVKIDDLVQTLESLFEGKDLF